MIIDFSNTERYYSLDNVWVVGPRWSDLPTSKCGSFFNPNDFTILETNTNLKILDFVNRRRCRDFKNKRS